MEREWVSLNEFMKINHMGYETVKKMMAEGTIEYQKINGQYKIKLTKNAEISKYTENLIRRNEELETSLKMALDIIQKVLKERSV